MRSVRNASQFRRSVVAYMREYRDTGVSMRATSFATPYEIRRSYLA
jgi:hypothetical protein